MEEPENADVRWHDNLLLENWQGRGRGVRGQQANCPRRFMYFYDIVYLSCVVLINKPLID